MQFKISIPLDSTPVFSSPYRINPIRAKQVNAALDQYLFSGLIQHSTSPYANPMVVIPKKDDNVWATDACYERGTPIFF